MMFHVTTVDQKAIRLLICATAVILLCKCAINVRTRSAVCLRIGFSAVASIDIYKEKIRKRRQCIHINIDFTNGA